MRGYQGVASFVGDVSAAAELGTSLGDIDLQ